MPNSPCARRIVVLLCLLSTEAANARSPQEATPAGTIAPPTRRVIVPPGFEAPKRAPLLREGGIMLKVPGTISKDLDLGIQVFQPDRSRTGGLDRELILLPSRGLEDLARLEPLVVERQGDGPGRYEVTGSVLVYRGRNFLYPDAIVPVDGGAAKTPDSGTDDVDPSEPSGGSPESEDDRLDRIGDDLERRLERRIGAVPRSLDALGAEAPQAAAIPSGTRFVDRRGRLSRDPSSGVWRFVLAGRGAGENPSIVLLPCLELERIERMARESDVSTPILVSGTVTTYRGRNFLLPTRTQRSEEGRGITD